LHFAAASGDVRTAELLIEAGAELEARSVSGFTPLHLAASGGKLDMIDLLVARGANLEATGKNRVRTPLYTAAVTGQLAAVTRLLALGANANGTGGQGRPILIALDEDIKEVLRQHGATE
ncbi:MAG: ankyrin repeat domain-containing protein, partial [Alphaproteobacteria bacterium]